MKFAVPYQSVGSACFIDPVFWNDLVLMNSQLNSSLTPDQWSQRVKLALTKAAETPHDLGEEGNFNRLSVRRLIWNQAEEIIALNAKGIGYRVIAQQLTEQGVPISQAMLKNYIYAYRKQKGQAHSAAVPALSAKERLRNSFLSKA